MADKFDPYHEWLGIPASEQPPNHYRLLGIPAFEDSPTVIENAADQRMAHLRTFQAGKHSQESQRLLNEVAAARICLLNAEKKGRVRPRSSMPVRQQRLMAKPELVGATAAWQGTTPWANTASWKNWAKEASGPSSRPCTPSSTAWWR